MTTPAYAATLPLTPFLWLRESLRRGAERLGYWFQGHEESCVIVDLTVTPAARDQVDLRTLGHTLEQVTDHHCDQIHFLGDPRTGTLSLLAYGPDIPAMIQALGKALGPFRHLAVTGVRLPRS